MPNPQRRPDLALALKAAAAALALTTLLSGGLIVAAKPDRSAGRAPAASVSGSYTLPRYTLGEIQNAVLPNSIQNDRGIPLGGTGSDLWHASSDAPSEFWVLTDRGPNAKIKLKQEDRMILPVPDFDPMILKVRTEDDGSVSLLQTIPIVGQSGRPVTGLPNADGHDPPAWDVSARAQLGYKPSGLDPEGMVRTSGGDFWLVEEYAPSIVHVGADGRVLKRYVPRGTNLVGADYPVEAALPAVYSRRQDNRGFEGVALSPDERQLYVVLQSALGNPDARTGEASSNTRILVFSIDDEAPSAEYVYRFEPASSFPDTSDPRELKLSGVAAFGPDSLIVLERTDAVAKLFRVDLSEATNILDGRWDKPATSPSLEALDNPAKSNVTPADKQLLVDLSQLPGIPEKIEGLTILDATTLAIANDNDFNFSGFDADGNALLGNAESQIILLKLSSGLPLAR